jgi:Tfp pilus assembly protein PilF
MGYQAEALHDAERAVRFNPFSVDAQFVLAGAQQRLGRTVEARETLKHATELEPENFATWKQLAIYERDFWGEPEAAREHFERAVSLNPQDKQLRMEAGLQDTGGEDDPALSGSSSGEDQG